MQALRTIRCAASEETVDLWIMSEISSWTAQDFIGAVNAFGTDKHYTVNINSPGGDPFAAFAILDFVKVNGVKYTARIYGHAASAAAIISAGADRVEMGELSHLMVHLAYGGNDDGLLDSINDKQAQVFAAKTGKTKAAITKLLEAETWMDAKEAKAQGFADSIIKELAIAAIYKAEYMDPNEKKPEGEEVVAEEVKTDEATTTEATEEVDQEVEIPVSPAEAVQAGFSGKLKAKVKNKVSAELKQALADSIAEAKDVKAQLQERIDEVTALTDAKVKAETDAKTSADELATVKAEANALKAKVVEFTAEIEKLKQTPTASVEGEPKGGAGVQTPGGAAPVAPTVDQRREEVRNRVNATLDRVTKRNQPAQQ